MRKHHKSHVIVHAQILWVWAGEVLRLPIGLKPKLAAMIPLHSFKYPFLTLLHLRVLKGSFTSNTNSPNNVSILTSITGLGRDCKRGSHTWPAQGPRALKAFIWPRPYTMHCTSIPCYSCCPTEPGLKPSLKNRALPLLHCPRAACSLPPSLTDSTLTGEVSWLTSPITSGNDSGPRHAGSTLPGQRTKLPWE